MQRYPCQLAIRRPPSGGVQDLDLGTLTGEIEGEIVYDGIADVQDGEVSHFRDAQSTVPIDRLDATAWLPDFSHAALRSIESGQIATVTWPDGAQSIGVVRAKRQLDWTVGIQWLT